LQLAPARSGNGYQDYDEDAVEKAIRVRALTQSGLTTQFIRVLLDMQGICGSGSSSRSTACWPEPAGSQVLVTSSRNAGEMAPKKSEREAIDDVLRRLKKKYPDVPGKDLEQIVEKNYAAFQHAKLRDYIAVLVEHGAKSEITARKHKRH
jgi:DNA-binding transcriptional MerR regulator